MSNNSHDDGSNDDCDDSDINHCTSLTETGTSEAELCEDCSKIPWDDTDAMARLPTLRIKPNSSDTTCPVCHLADSYGIFAEPFFKCSSEEIDTLFGTNAGTRLQIEGASQDSSPTHSPMLFENSYGERLLLTSLDHEKTMTSLQRTFPTNANLSLISGWLRECKSEHNDCCSLRHRIQLRNLRVIDCEQMAIVDAPQECRFIALSYVWGDSTVSDSGDIENMQSLPVTIQQSIFVANCLKLRYLWIDRYCICQDDHDMKDEQISQMGDIYATAHLTIIAAAGDDPWFGLPGVHPTPRKPPRDVAVGHFRVHAVPTIWGHIDAFYFSTWASRAWTFQECFFSRRRLVFTKRQMMFVCNTSTHYEAVTLPFLGSQGDSRLTHCTPRNQDFTESRLDGTFIMRAQDYLDSYSRRNLRFDGDALNAVKGALNTLARDHVYHLWGVPFRYRDHNKTISPNQSIQDRRGEISLSWRNHKYIEKRPSRVACRRKEFPSWSPIGWDYHISFFTPADLAGISVQTNGGSADLGDILSSSGIIPSDCPQQLCLKLPTVNFALATMEGEFSRSGDTKVALDYRDGTYVCFQTIWDADVDGFQDQNSIKGILLSYTPRTESRGLPGSAYALLIQPCGQYYERVGIACLTLKSEYRENRYGTFGVKWVYQGRICKEMGDQGIENTNWWLGQSVKETIILV